MGLITLGVTYTTGEITTFMPRTGGFVRHATHFVEPALGAAVGWNFCTSRLPRAMVSPSTHFLATGPVRAASCFNEHN
jgi:amino acid permease